MTRPAPQYGPGHPLGGKYDPLTESPDQFDALLWAAITGSPAGRPPVVLAVSAGIRGTRSPIRSRRGPARPPSPGRPGRRTRGRAWSRGPRP
ncbi:MAG: hypothetical protein QOJ50_1603 [Cryptosporangiaceae bacterium]|nr:hypothetical protein [Cryptosporangiaceae bacterium]